jgi:hypothetical protein
VRGSAGGVVARINFKPIHKIERTFQSLVATDLRWDYTVGDRLAPACIAVALETGCPTTRSAATQAAKQKLPAWIPRMDPEKLAIPRGVGG